MYSNQCHADVTLTHFISNIRGCNCSLLCLSYQWTGSGPNGAAGVPALCPVVEAAVREHANAQTQPHSLEVTGVKEMTYKLIFATVILVLVSAFS